MQIDLKAYTSRAKELEAAIHTQKNLMELYEQVVKTQAPIAPTKKQITAPTKPQEPIEPINTYKTPIGLLLLVIGGTILFFCLWLSCITSEDRHIGVQFMEIIWFIGGAICAWLTYVGFKEKSQMSEDFEKRKAQYEKDKVFYPRLVEKYNRDFQKYQEEQSKASSQYGNAYDCYLKELNEYNENHHQMTDRHNNAYSSLVSALDTLYEENVIFPKYRNFVAISAINEYLLSGRCDKLEGPDGAYNLYEMELRQNIIIGQLSNIIGNLEQIRNNQYSLYQELQRSNQTVNEIIYEIRNLRDDTKLLTYFAGITALAETSPRYYYGITM